ncbi:GapR family DNA-binding domain-containing protein [Bosea sp. (in: a-proteobacteria)]|uniref:GapR family DNA-binding domain-containing protein n=1 Tax=Bosea sp. (in: a-proteobacteria) TaxID=1871050 RepID=UPI003B3BAB53
MSISNTVSGEKLKSYVERLERIDSEVKELKTDRAVIVAELKADGFDPKYVGYVLKARAATPSELQEDRALKDIYLAAIGLAPEPPLFRAMGLLDVDPTSRESVIDAWSKMVEPGGSVTITPKDGKPFVIAKDITGTISVTDVVERRGPERSERSTGPKPKRESAPAPDVDAEGAFALGEEAAKLDQPVIANPFPFGDARRARWDEGWRKGAGSDGMGD